MNTKATFATILFVALLFLSSSVLANERPTRFGFLGGLNIAGVWGNEAGGSGTRSASIGGIALLLPTGSNSSIRMEVLLSQKGTEATFYDPFSDQFITARGNVDYIELPFLFDVQLSEPGSSGVHFFTGPAVSIPLSSTVELGTTSFDVSNMRNPDVGLIVGSGLVLGSGRSQFTLDVRYNLGLTQLFDNRTADQAVADLSAGEVPVVWPDTGEGVQFKNAVLSFTVGVLF